MVDTGGCTGRVDPNCPDSGTGILKAQKNQLATGGILYQFIAKRNSGAVQDKGNFFQKPEAGGDTGDVLSAG